MSVVLAPFRGLVSEFRLYLQAAKQIPDGACCTNCGRDCRFNGLGIRATNLIVCTKWIGDVAPGRCD